ncbi:hypothetical protein Tco_0795809 [Tanacetum coccineum]
MQTQESKIDTGKALDADLVVTEALGQNSSKCQISSNQSREGYICYDGNIRPSYVAKKKVQERDRNSTTSVPTSARIQTTTDDSKPNPMSNNQHLGVWPVSKSNENLASWVNLIHIVRHPMLLAETLSRRSLNLPDHRNDYLYNKKETKNRILGRLLDFIIIYVKQECNKYEHVGQEHKLIKESNQDDSIQVDDASNNESQEIKSKDKGSKSRSQSMDEQSHNKQDKTITRQSINVKRHIFNVIGDTEKFEERDLNIGGDFIVRVICEEFVDLKLAIRQDLGFIPSGNVVLSSTYVGKILGADQLLVILCYRYQESGIGYWILSMTISGSGVSILRIMTGRSTRSNTANNTNPPNETIDEVTQQLNTALPNLLTQLVQALGGNRANQREVTQSCSIKTFRASGAKEFFSTEGAIGLLTWFESIKSVLHITKCPA